MARSSASNSLNTDLLKRLCETPGVPGREHRVRELIKKEVKDLFDEVREDPMGNLLCRRAPKGKAKKSGDSTRVMIPCHMDEIGFLVKYIDDKGFIRVNPVGGFDTRNLFARRVLVHSGKDAIHGVMNPGGRPIHIASEEDKKKVPEIKEFFIDTGLDADEVKKKVKVGDMVTLDEPFRLMGRKAVSKALDNRVACWLGIESVRALADSGKDHACEVHVAFTVQEEVGLRGAKTAAAAIKPHLGIGIDVSLSCDTPGVPDDEAVTKQGEGAGLHVMDSSIISDIGLIEELEACAQKHKIKTQRTILARGGQDGAAAQQIGEGCRAAGLVVGTRYIHTVTEMIDLRDLEAARDLLAAWLSEVK